MTKKNTECSKGLFSDYFKVNKNTIKKYGAIDISLDTDMPFFIDPMLIFNSDKNEYKRLHDRIINYFTYLSKLSKRNISKDEFQTYFTFKEIKNNWLGYSNNGCNGKGLNTKFAKALEENICKILDNHKISSGKHIEKITLLSDGVGKDKISDMTTNIIMGYLCEYTQKFAIKNIKKENIKKFVIDKAEFDGKTGLFATKTYELPYINKNGKKEFVLLTPRDMVRYESITVSKNDFISKMDLIIDSISNRFLRNQLNQYLITAIENYKKVSNNKKGLAKVKREAFNKFAESHQEVYDYYLKYNENNEEIASAAKVENDRHEELINYFVLPLINSVNRKYNSSGRNSKEEAINRVKFLKKQVEDNDVYKIFYGENGVIINERNLQYIFRLVWLGSKYDLNKEPNNGGGPADFTVSYGANDKTVIEFKLASNTQLSNILAQTNRYCMANNTTKKIMVIFFFNENENNKIVKLLNNNSELVLNDNVFMVDCREKKSASKIYKQE